MFSNQIYDTSGNGETIGAWQRAVLVVAVIFSVVAGLAAFAYLSTAHPAEQRVTWVLVPPKAKTAAARTVAAANLQAAQVIVQHGT